MFMFGKPIGRIFRPSNAWIIINTLQMQYPIMDIMYILYQLFKRKQLQNGNDCHCKIITQNVDGLHQRSGFDDDQIVEMHGSASKYICSIFGHDMNEQFNINDFNHK